MSLLDTYRYDGTKKFDIKKAQTDSHCDKDQENKIIKLTGKNIEKISELQDKFYADAKESIVLVLQAMDAAGKDGTVKHVMSGLNPQGVDVFSFKTPNSNEAAHDFLWRYHRRMPVRGKMALFNRSWYEEVLIVKVHDLYKDYHMADRCIGKNFFKMKYDQITAFEKHLYENSYRIVKIF
jgi:polyphosphate kinase 2 (PPK2 family)